MIFCLYAKTKTQISLALTAKLNSAFVFASRIVQFLFYLNPKFEASSHCLKLHRQVCVRPGRKNPKDQFFCVKAHISMTILPLGSMSRKSVARSADCLDVTLAAGLRHNAQT